MKKIGVIADQDSLRSQCQILERIGHQAVEVLGPQDLEQIHGLILGGKDCFALGRLLQFDELRSRIRLLVHKDLPVFAFGEGMTILAKTVLENDSANDPSGDLDKDHVRLELMDITVMPSAIGCGPDGLHVLLKVPALGKDPYPACFFTAPYAEKVAPNVGILSLYEKKIVFVRQGNLIAASFCPELTSDYRVHRYFLEIIEEYWS